MSGLGTGTTGRTPGVDGQRRAPLNDDDPCVRIAYAVTWIVTAIPIE
jgi:hypothetical protein